MSFKKNKYTVLRKVISKDLANFVANYFSMKKQVRETCLSTKFISPYETLLGDKGDPQAPNSYSHYADIVMESGLAIHDFLALVPIVNGAGGCISDWSGRPLTFSSGKQVLATANPTLHAICLRIISDA